MRKWLRRVRGAVLMGLTWAVIWAPAGVLIGMIVDPDGSMDEMWVAVGAYPGFLGGLVFATVLGIVGRRRRFDELSIRRFAAWGALAGLLVGAFPFVAGEPTTEIPLWLLGVTVVGSITLLSAVSAAASLALARRAERRELLDAGVGVPALTVPDAATASGSLHGWRSEGELASGTPVMRGASGREPREPAEHEPARRAVDRRP